MDIFRDLIANIRKNELVRNILFLLSSNGLAQLFPFLIYPFISRLYSTEAFGQLAIIVSVHSLLVSVASGKYEQAIPLPSEDTQARHLFNIGLRITLVISLLVIPVVFIVQMIDRSPEGNTGVSNWFYVLAITVFSAAYVLLTYGWCVRFKLFRIMVSGTLVLSASAALLKLLFGFLQMENGLLLGFIAAQVITAVFITYRIMGSSHKPAMVAGRDMYITAGMYAGFPKYNMINALLNTFSSNMPVYAFALYFAHDTIGQFSVALALLFTPVNTYNNSINQVLYKRTIEIKNAGQQIWPFIKKYISRTLMISVIPGLLLILLIPYIIRLYLGPQWSDAGRFCQFMIPYAVGILISGSLAFIPNVFKKQLNSLLIYVVYLVFRIGALGLGIFLKDVYLAVGLYSLVSLLAVTYQVFWYRKIILASDHQTSL